MEEYFEEIRNRFKEEYSFLTEYNLLEDTLYLLSINMVINIDTNDFDLVFKDSKLCSYFNDNVMHGEFEINKVSKEEPDAGILVIISNQDITLRQCDEILTKVSNQNNNNMSLIYGFAIDRDIPKDYMRIYFVSTKKIH